MEAKSLPGGDRDRGEHYTGKFVCTLTTESPLYTRCGWTPDDFAKYGDTAFSDLPEGIKQERAGFFINPATQEVTIPGSSLRGMLRTAIEIVSFSKIEFVSGQNRLFFRGVAGSPNKDSLAKEYKKYINTKNVKAGYLKKDREAWFIQPAKGATFVWVKEESLELPKLIKFDDDGYQPQHISVSYDKIKIDTSNKNPCLFAKNVGLLETYPKKGVLVTSGNMKQGEESSPRRNHCLVLEANSNAKPLRIDNIAIENYWNALTDFQKQPPFDKDLGMFCEPTQDEEEKRPIFYCEPTQNNLVTFFGHSPNFRIPFSPKSNGQAVTVADFIPKDLQDISVIDLADAIFGWVKNNEDKNHKLPEELDQQRAGRVFVRDAICTQKSDDDIWLKKGDDKSVTSQILSSPKPTTFQHYLVQTDVDRLNPKKLLKHYASQPIEETVIRGHKLYWHKESNPDIEALSPSSKNPPKESQETKITPLKTGVSFELTIDFENLSDSEQTEYMNLDRFRSRPVVPTPLQVMEIEDKRKGISKDLPIKKPRKNRGSDRSNVFKKGPKPPKPRKS